MDQIKKIKKPEFSFSQPAIYQIKVLGRIPENWIESLSEMNISYKKTDGKVITTLIGKLSDQSALSGVLNNLYDLHLSVLSVKKIKE